jgi:hypothetical protein
LSQVLASLLFNLKQLLALAVTASMDAATSWPLSHAPREFEFAANPFEGFGQSLNLGGLEC